MPLTIETEQKLAKLAPERVGDFLQTATARKSTPSKQLLLCDNGKICCCAKNHDRSPMASACHDCTHPDIYYY